MTKYCDGCHTPNRDKARYCRGCAGKFSGFRFDAAAFVSTLPDAGASMPMLQPAGQPQMRAPTDALTKELRSGRVEVRAPSTTPKVLPVPVWGPLLAISAGLVAWHFAEPSEPS